MMPLHEINIGDVFCAGYPFVNEYAVVEKSEGMVKLMVCGPNMSYVRSPLNKPFWKKPTDQLFTERNRVLNSKLFGANP